MNNEQDSQRYKTMLERDVVLKSMMHSLSIQSYCLQQFGAIHGLSVHEREALSLLTEANARLQEALADNSMKGA